MGSVVRQSEGLRRSAASTLLACMLWLALWLGHALPAQAANIQSLTLERTEEGLFLSSVIQLELGQAVEDALLRSVPIYFVAQAEVLRERWYWSDRRVASVSRTYRLAYQPLTRRWRVSVSSGSGPGAGLQYALHQNHASLTQAMLTITRMSDWQLAEASRLEVGVDYRVDYRFKLDMALLPRPFQLGMNAQTDWNLDLRHSLDAPTHITADKEADAPTTAPQVQPPKTP